MAWNRGGLYCEDPVPPQDPEGNLQRQGSVNFITPADYTEGGRAYEIVCAIIDKIKADTNLQELKKI